MSDKMKVYFDNQGADVIARFACPTWEVADEVSAEARPLMLDGYRINSMTFRRRGGKRVNLTCVWRCLEKSRQKTEKEIRAILADMLEIVERPTEEG